MGEPSERENWRMTLLRIVGPTVISVVFAAGVYSSQIKSDRQELLARIDTVAGTSRTADSVIDQMHGVKLEGIERRVVALETLTRDNAQVNQQILRTLAALETSSRYQNESLAELKKQVSDLVARR